MDPRAAALAAQPCPGEAARVQVMPGGVARIDQALAAARAGREQAEAQRREVADQVVAARRQQREGADERRRVIVGRPAAGTGLLEQAGLLAAGGVSR
jgi:hypothetical protein